MSYLYQATYSHRKLKKLMNELYTTHKGIDELLIWIQMKGSDALLHLIVCACNSADSTGHDVLANLYWRLRLGSAAAQSGVGMEPKELFYSLYFSHGTGCSLFITLLPVWVWSRVTSERGELHRPSWSEVHRYSHGLCC